MNFITIIPARFFSSRFPGKMLADIQGKPMIIRVIERALATKTIKVIIATDSVSIKQVVECEYSLNNKVEVCLTRITHQSGTERISEVVRRYQFSKNQIIVQLQGDEPLILPHMIHKLVNALNITKNNVSVSTLAMPISSYQEAIDNNVVKVVINIYGIALYFSRSIIPWNKTQNYLDQGVDLWLRHVGIYSYRVSFLYRYMQWIISPLEKYEMLEQLRVLWHGEKIHVSIIRDVFNISVDTPKSLKQVNEFLVINNKCL